MLQIPPNQCQGYTIRHLLEKAPVGGTTVELFRMTAVAVCLMLKMVEILTNLFYQSYQLCIAAEVHDFGWKTAAVQFEVQLLFRVIAP